MKPNKLLSLALITLPFLSAASYQVRAQQPISGSTRAGAPADGSVTFDLSRLLARAAKTRQRGFSLMTESGYANIGVPAFGITLMTAGSLPVLGGGTLGRLTKWTGFTSSNAAIGDSTIYEDKFGKVGIGTDAPTSKLTVEGIIESTGGFKFPDGSVKMSAGVIHDASLKGDGTTSSALGVNVPLILSGTGNPGEIISVTATGSGGQGINVEAGPSGLGMFVRGGKANNDFGGDGIVAMGGEATSNTGGTGISALGGLGNDGDGGLGIRATGGTGTGAGKRGGNGITASAGTGTNGATDGLAGRFLGAVEITGKLTVTSGMKMFHIDHPLDPENKYLNHAAIESSEVLNVYSGNVATNADGSAVVTLPDWFEALNHDFRYQLTVLGTFARAIVAEEIKSNRFVIQTDAPNVKVSWQVTGVRSDPTARKFKFEVEEEKAERERGFYLNPDAYGQPEEKSINWARDPEGMRHLKRRQIEAEQTRQKRQPSQR